MKEEKKRIFNEKPKFSVKKADDTAKADIQVLIAPFECIKDDESRLRFVYDKKFQKDKDIVFKDYIFENTGKSAAKYFSIIMNQKKHFSIFEYSRRKREGSMRDMLLLTHCSNTFPSIVESNDEEDNR